MSSPDRLLWTAGQKFQPDRVAKTLDLTTTTYTHSKFGGSYVWELDLEQAPALRLEFYPKNRLFRLGIGDNPLEYQFRDYIANQMRAISIPEVAQGLRVSGLREGHFSVVSVFNSGVIQEAHLLGQNATAADRELILANHLYSSTTNSLSQEELLIVSQAAKRLGLGESTVRKMAAGGQLASQRYGRQYLISDSTLRAFEETS